MCSRSSSVPTTLQPLLFYPAPHFHTTEVFSSCLQGTMCSAGCQSPCRSPGHRNPFTASPVGLPGSLACTRHRGCWLDPAVPRTAARSLCRPPGCHCPPSFCLSGEAAAQMNRSRNSGCHLGSSRRCPAPKPASGSVTVTLRGIPLFWGTEALLKGQSSLLPRRYTPNSPWVKRRKNAQRSGMEERRPFPRSAPAFSCWNPDVPPGGWARAMGNSTVDSTASLPSDGWGHPRCLPPLGSVLCNSPSLLTNALQSDRPHPFT